MWLRAARGELEAVVDSKQHAIPERASESGYSARRITTTASFAAALLFVAGQI